MKTFKKLINTVTKKIMIISLSLAMIISLFNFGQFNPIKAEEYAKANITFTSKVMKSIGSSDTISSVQSGEPFFLSIGYNVLSGGEGVRYNGCMISIELPKNVVFDKLEQPAGASSVFNKAEVDDPFHDGTQFVKISSDNVLAAGEAGTLYLKLHFKNMETKNGMTATFDNMSMTGTQISGGTSTPLEDVKIPSATIIATADQEWEIKKSGKLNENLVSENGIKYYKVDYEVAINTAKDENRYGRLNCEVFNLIDTLPTGYPVGGGATNLSINSGSKTLVEGTDYTVTKNKDDSIKSVKFLYVNKYKSSENPSETHFIPDGASINTTYTMSVLYPYEAYKILSNEDFIKKILVNKADLTYQPLGEKEKTVEDNATVNLGWQEEDPYHRDITVTKKIDISATGTPAIGINNPQILDEHLQSIYYRDGKTIQFGLYTDEACTNLAPTYDGKGTAGTVQPLNKTGQVSFKDLHDGVYYLKEFNEGLLFEKTAPLKIEIQNDGKINVDDKLLSGDTIDVINKTTETGYGYVAFWKRGSSATQADAGWLKDVQFTLTSKTDSTKKYTAISDVNGLVLFSGIPAGDYIISENNAGGEFIATTETWDITVIGNQVNYPENMEKYTDGDKNYPYVLNKSEKGKFKIIKKAATIPSTDEILDGATFTVYERTHNTELTDDYLKNFDPTTASSSFTLASGEESKALTPGYYVYKETKAPDGYTLDSSYRIVHVTKNHLEEVTVTNQKKGKLTVFKYGILSVDFPASIGIDGSEFQLYTDKECTKPVLGAEDKPLIIAPKLAVNGEAFMTVEVDAGTYYLKETKAPDGYILLEKPLDVVIAVGQETKVSIDNIAIKKGQLKIIKKDSKNNQLLNNAEFTIYKKDGTEVEKLKATNNDGVATSTFLDSGEYYVKETKSPDGYALLTSKVDFTIKDNEVTTLESEVANDPFVKFQLKKVDVTNNDKVLSGVNYRLYNEDPSKNPKASYVEETTDVNGLITFTGLIPGTTYYYQESKTINGYTLDKTVHSFEAPAVNQTNDDLTQAGGPLVVKNAPQGRLLVKKTITEFDSTNKVPLSGITFYYYPKVSENSTEDKENAKTNQTYLTLGTTDKDGKLLSQLVDAGQYWVEEVNVEPYKTIAPQSVTVKAGVTDTSIENNNILSIENQYSKGKFKIEKISSLLNGNQPVYLNAHFNLYNYVDNNTDYSKEKPLLNFNTNNGSYTSAYLDVGDYVIVEQSVEGQYDLDKTPHKLTITAGHTNTDYTGNQAIKNTPTSSLSLIKYEVWNSALSGEDPTKFQVANFNFKIYTAVECNSNETGAIKKDDKYYKKDKDTGKTLTSVNSGKATLSDLSKGFYIVEEALTKDQIDAGYTKAASQVVELVEGQESIVTFENRNKNSKIKVIKVDAANHDTKLDNAEFEIYREATASEKGTQFTIAGQEYNLIKNGSVKIVSGTAIIIDNNGNEVTEKGVGYSELLKPDIQYFLREVTPPNGYQASEEWTIVGPLKTGELSTVTIENFKPITPIGYKKDGLNQNVANATFGLFYDQKSADKIAKMTDTQLATLLNQSVDEQKKQGLMQTCVTNETGEIKFKDLDTTKTYYVLELKSAEGYERNKDIHEVKIKYDEKDGKYYLIDKDGEILSVINYEYQKIWLKKNFTFGGVTTPLNGITFHVFKAVKTEGSDGVIQSDGISYKKGEKVTEMVTGTDTAAGDGSCVSKGLPADQYIIEEIENEVSNKLGLVINDENKYHFVTLTHIDKDNSDNKVLYNDAINNETKYGQFYLDKVSNIDNHKLTATFELEVKKGTEYETYQNFTFNTDGIKIYQLPIYLPVGQYRLVEKSVEGGYTLNSTPIDFEIKANQITGMANGIIQYYNTISDALANPIKVVNNAQGRVSFTKQGHQLVGDTVSDTVLKDVQFNVYKKKMTSNKLVLDATTLVGNATSDNNGLLVFKNLNNQTIKADQNWLDAGDYILKEVNVGNTNATNGYTPDFLGQFTIVTNTLTNKIIPIDESGNTGDVLTDKIINESHYGKFKLTKKDFYQLDGKDKLLAGVHFDIYANDQKTIVQSDVVTDANGILQSSLLPAGNYYVKEKSTLAGYVLDDDFKGPYEVEALKVTQSDEMVITNVMKQSLKVVKKDSVSKNEIADSLMPGTQFELYDENQTTLIATKSYVSGEGIVFTNLLPNTKYYLKETKAPSGYELKTGFTEVTTGTTQSDSATAVMTSIDVENDLLGSLKIEKQAVWNIQGESNVEKLPLKDVEFSLYDNENKFVETKATDKTGIVIFTGLKQGKYTLKETKQPDGFVKNEDTYEVTITKGQQNNVYTGEKAIINQPNLGKFMFKKVKADNNPLDKAIFKLVKIVDGKEKSVSTAFDAFSTDAEGDFISAMLSPGQYKLYETSAPEGYTAITPITFEIVAKQVTKLTNGETAGQLVDNAQGSVEIIKYDDVQTYIKAKENQPLQGVHFGLYKNDDTLIAEKITDGNGKILWENLDPGDYYVKEIDHKDNPAGYEYSDNQYNVTVKTGESKNVTYHPTIDGNTDGKIINHSQQGKLIITKTDKISGKGLAGAEFEVYAMSGETQTGKPVTTLTTDQDGQAISGLLDAESSGTNYFVEETKAPDGYVLDDEYNQMKGIVTVYPVQNTEFIIGSEINKISFKNTKLTDLMNFTTGIKKGITSHLLESVNAPTSLSKNAYSTVFSIRDFASGDNTVPAKSLSVTDTKTQFQYYDADQGKYINDTKMNQDSYIINSVSVYSAFNHKSGTSSLIPTDIDTTKVVNAQLYYQTYGSDVWQEVPNGKVTDLQKLSTSIQKVEIDPRLKAAHIKVEYTGVDIYFESHGFDIDVTFNQRPSGAEYHEIRRISNIADVDYYFLVKDNLGTKKIQKVTKPSKEVAILFPTLESEIPTVKIGVIASNPDDSSKTTFKPGDTVQFDVTAQNISINGSEFADPIMSFDLPIGMSLNNAYAVGQTDRFKLVQGTIAEDGTMNGNTIDLSDVIITYTPIDEARIVDKGELVKTDSPTTKVTFRFKNNRSLKPGESLRITLAATVALNETKTTLWMPTYLNSDLKDIQSAENPYGNSFSVNNPTSGGSSNPLVEDKDLDSVLGNEVGGDKFANSNTDITVNENNSLSIYKQVKGVYDNEYLNYNQIAQTSSGGKIDYNIQVSNGADSDAAINKIRIVDLLPFEGDSLVGRDNLGGTITSRSTALGRAPTLNDVDITKVPTGATTKIYYCIDSQDIDTKWDKWTVAERSNVTAEKELPMLYGSMDDNVWDGNANNHNWVLATSVPDEQLKYVSAIAVEVVCQNEVYLKKGQDISVHIGMTAPMYGTDEVDLYSDKLISNSAMVAVSRVGHGNDIANSDRTENHEVKVRLTMPKGSIGDYAFYDINRNGIQDIKDAPIAGLNVTLHEFKTYYENGLKKTAETTKTTKTDESGYYLFDLLDCNVPLDKKNANSTDPNDFASGAYYEYQVEFALPDDESRYQYEPTQRYVGSDMKVDSNIGADPSYKDDYLKTEVIRLTATQNGNDFTGESNLTLDAGFKALGALGDYVWFDANRNGIQDSDEKGINGVTVNLYDVVNGKAGHKLATTKTNTTYGKDGYYMFEKLGADQYIVEFDVSDLITGGYSQYYAFTKAFQGTNTDNDSNASLKVNDRIMQSDVITLDARGYDMSIDAGVTVYSALSGIAFEDRNYSDVQDLDNGIDVVVPGTVVELYLINDKDGQRGDKPIATQTVGDDGKYYFDHLIEGQYQVKFTFPDGYKIVNANVGDDTLDNDIEYDLSKNMQDGFTDIINIPLNSLVEHVDGGATRYSSLGDYVWFDANKNGLQDNDPAEYAIKNVPVYLQMKSPETSGWEQVAEAITDKNGHYRFDNLKSSDYGTGIEYRVIFDLPIDSQLTIVKNGNVALDSNALALYVPGAGFPTDNIHLGYNTVDLTWDAGIIESRGSVGDYVWFDDNQNGIQDEKNTGIANIPVILEYNESGDLSHETNWNVVGKTTTNASGYYIFNDLVAGMYRVRFQIDKPYYVTLSNMGSDNAIDSDGVTLFNKNWYYSRAFYLEEEGYDMTWDCGVYVPGQTYEEIIHGLKTEDKTSIYGLIGIGGISLATVAVLLYTGQKKKKKEQHK